MPYLEELSLVYEQSLIVESNEKRIAYLNSRYHVMLMGMLESPIMDRDNAIDWVTGGTPHRILDKTDLFPTVPALPGETKERWGNRYFEHVNAVLASQMIKYVVNTVDFTHGRYSEWFIKTLISIGVDENTMPESEFAILIILVSEIDNEDGSREDYMDSYGEDFYKWGDYFAAYDKHKQSLPQEQRDINSFTTFGAFIDVAVVLVRKNKQVRFREMRQSLDPKTYDIIIPEIDGWAVVVPKTKDAAIALGGDTVWCTSDEREQWNAFEKYNSKGPLLMFMKGGDPVYQMHGDKEFMDVDNKPAQYREIPSTVWTALSKSSNERLKPFIEIYGSLGDKA